MPRFFKGGSMFSMSFVPKIVIVNIVVFLLWNTYGLIYPEFMINNFLVSWTSLSQGRFWTLLTSVFSHNMTWHIFINMFVFFNFGLIVENYLGPVRFLGFYLIAGITGSLVHCLVCAFILKQPNLMALGASGAISGVVMLFALSPTKNLSLWNHSHSCYLGGHSLYRH
jgi:rhomboid protease GluP